MSGALARGLADPVPLPGRWSDLRIRVLSAVVLLPLALGCVWVGGGAYVLLIGAAALGLGAEWLGLRRRQGGGDKDSSPSPCGLGPRSGPRMGGGVAGAVPQPGWTDSPPASGSSAGPPTPTLPRKGGGSLLCASRLFALPRLITAAGFFYVAVACVSLLWLRADPLVGRANVLIMLLLVWASDVGAYAAGRAIGGPRLAPRISPGKTIAGAAGGLAAAVAVALGAALVLGPAPHLPRAGLLAAGLGVVAQAGDLFESWVKRRLGVKDSGTLIPGHGGLFDRLDAVLAAAPAAALLALWAGRGLAWWQ